MRYRGRGLWEYGCYGHRTLDSDIFQPSYAGLKDSEVTNLLYQRGVAGNDSLDTAPDAWPSLPEHNISYMQYTQTERSMH